MNHSSYKELKPTILKAYHVGKEGYIQHQCKGGSFSMPRLTCGFLKEAFWEALPVCLCHTPLLLQKSMHDRWLRGTQLALY